MEPYLVSYVVDHMGLVHDNWKPFLLDVCLHRFSDKTQIEITWDTVEYYLPRILSVSPVGREMYVRETKDNLPPVLGQMIHVPPQRMNILGEYRNGDDQNIVDRLLPILDCSRAVDRNEWMMVGWVLFNIFRGQQEGLDRWITFSEKSPENFNLDVCRSEWSRMIRKDLTIGTLKYMAKQDNYKEYNEIMNEFMTPHIEQAMKLNGAHNDLARALFEKYESYYVCASIKEKIWFEYSNHGWNRIDEGFSLRMKISEELVRSYEQMMKGLVEKLTRADEDEEVMVKKKLKNCMKIITNLKSAPFKNNIMKECMEVFYQPKFMRELDTNPFLFTFQNGVYDLSTHTFRDGRPADKVSILAPISYRNDLFVEHPEVQEVLRFFEKIFPDRSIFEYFMDVSSQVFIGGNHAKIVQVWTGEGDNGKSVTQQLFEKMLGSYSIKLPTSLIIGKRTQSSAACPELVRAGNGVRIAMLQEPDGKDVINVGILKELSGNDSFFARGLYKEGSEITPMFKLVLICNDPPKLPYNDKAAWNRIRVIPFESLFVDNPPEDPDEQLLKKIFPKDTSLGDRVASMAEAFAWLLIDHLKKHPKIRSEPEKVRMATANYRKKNDIYRQFVDDHVVREEGSCISVQQSYNIFKEWFREGVPNAPVPIRDDFREYMTKILGEPVLSFWKNVRIRSIQSPEQQRLAIQEEDNDDDDDPLS
jgi:P4 family phage/plasmid primase-like protien